MLCKKQVKTETELHKRQNNFLGNNCKIVNTIKQINVKGPITVIIIFSIITIRTFLISRRSHKNQNMRLRALD